MYIPAANSSFSSSVSLGWKTPFFHATVTHVNVRLKSPKESLKIYHASCVSVLPLFCVVRAGDGGIAGEYCDVDNCSRVSVALWVGGCREMSTGRSQPANTTQGDSQVDIKIFIAAQWWDYQCVLCRWGTDVPQGSMMLARS
jgi:hypothetical protein